MEENHTHIPEDVLYKLVERNKELRFVYDILGILIGETRPLFDTLLDILKILPESMQYPEHTCGRINIKNLSVSSDNFNPSFRSISEKINVDGSDIGSITIAYDDEAPVKDDTLFLEEEKEMLTNIGRTISLYMESIDQEKLARKYLETTNNLFVVVDKTGVVLDANEKTCELMKIRRNELLGKNWMDEFVPDYARSELVEYFNGIMEEKPNGLLHYNNDIISKNGKTYSIEWFHTLDFSPDGEVDAVIAFGVDITEKKLVFEEVQKSRNLLSDIIENIPVRVFWKDRESRFLGCNTLFANDAGLAGQKDFIGKDDFQFAWHEQAELYQADDRRVMDADKPVLNIEEPQTRADGSNRWVRTSKVPLHDKKGNVIGILGIYDDITDEKKAAEKLRKSEESLKRAQEIAQLGSWELDHKKNVLICSDEAYRISEIELDAVGAPFETFVDKVHPEDLDLVTLAFNRQWEKQEPFEMDFRLLFDDERIKYIHVSCETNFLSGKACNSFGTVQDITRQKLDEIRLQRLNRTLKTLSAGNEKLVHAVDEKALLNDMCRLIVEVGGYRMAWVGYAEKDEEKTISPEAQFGYEEDYLNSVKISWSDNKSGKGPSGTAVRTGQFQVVADTANDPSFEPWREQALKYGYASVVAFPLIQNESSVFGVLVIHAEKVNAFDDEELALFQELANDLSYGIVNLRTRIDHEHTTRQLHDNLVDTIGAIANTIEARDPYTAGHQNRVAELCVAIGRELGLSEDRIEGLQLGALIHDIGKIYIPGEILNRPGKLTENEFGIIKSHTQVGYNVIKEIDFPWPIALMVLQHHERIDGSGYPNGLKGRQVIKESRILAVADVVEAMTSHRPYRPSRGVEFALEEISSGRGSKYDPKVVDTCLDLFRNKGFEFSSNA